MEREFDIEKCTKVLRYDVNASFIRSDILIYVEVLKLYNFYNRHGKHSTSKMISFLFKNELQSKLSTHKDLEIHEVMLIIKIMTNMKLVANFNHREYSNYVRQARASLDLGEYNDPTI